MKQTYGTPQVREHGQVAELVQFTTIESLVIIDLPRTPIDDD